MATPLGTPIDLPIAIFRLRPTSEYLWTGGAVGVYGNIAEWRDRNTSKPTEQELYTEYDAYLAEKAVEDQNAASDETKVSAAKTGAKAIPNWATWDEATAVNWITTNVTDLASAKQVLIAFARLLVALRDDTWPDLDRS